MSGKDHRDTKRVPVALRIKLRFRNVDTFISKFATNISATGMFISSRKPRESGTQLRFELRLADDSTVIAGKGRVVWVREYDPDHPKDPHGMGIEFVSLSKGSRELLAKIVEQRVHQGLGEGESIPHALEAEAKTEAEAEQTPVAEPPAQAVPTGHRPLPTDLTLQELDSSAIDLQAALRRARELVGSGTADSELDQLFRVSAAPIAETVDDASHRLAQMLGGKAVRGRRQQRRDPATDHAAAADYLSEDAPTPIPVGDQPESVAEALAQPEVTGTLAAETLVGEDELSQGDELDVGGEVDRITSVGEDPSLLAEDLPPIEDDLDDLLTSDIDTSQEELAVPALDSALSSLDSEFEEPPTRGRAETDEEPIVISDEPLDELDMLEDDEGGLGMRTATSVPSGIDVDVLDPSGLEDNGIYELSKPGTGPIDLLKLADLPGSRGNDDDDDFDDEIELDLPD